MVQDKLPKDDLTEERWKKMSEEIAECKKLSWKVQPLNKRKSGGNIGNEEERGRTRQIENQKLPPESPTTNSRRHNSAHELGTDVDDEASKPN